MSGLRSLKCHSANILTSYPTLVFKCHGLNWQTILKYFEVHWTKMEDLLLFTCCHGES